MKPSSLHKLALGGAIALEPAGFLVVAGPAQSLLGFRQLNDALDALFASPTFSFTGIIFHPVIILGGLLLGAGMNAVPLVHFTFDSEEQTFIAKVVLKQRFFNFMVSAGSVTLPVTILAYSVGENFTIMSH